MTYEIPSYLTALPPSLLERADADAEPVPAVAGLRVARGLRARHPHIESDEALRFVCALYDEVREDLRQVLDRRASDRAFIDAEVTRCVERNAGKDYTAPDYHTVIGAADPSGRIVVGPLPPDDPYRRQVLAEARRVEVPPFLVGDQVTLFGPPDTEKMAINAMNALHRRRPDEPALVAELVEASGQVPRWGADNEDSKTPIMESFLRACENLTGCFDGTLAYDDPRTRKRYRLHDERRSVPIKRIPGLALPDGNHLLRGNPLPLHLLDFGLHLFHNRERPEALVFYVPKLESEEEARYVAKLVRTGEAMAQRLHPGYRLGTVRLLIVFEAARSIFRIREIAHELHPYFLGGSLGWHDFLASTARVMRKDPNYRIPVKADPNIVINHIKESHLILVRNLEPIGGLKIGGMYGTLFEEGNAASFEVAMVGFIKDVVTQLRRGLDGYWVAHPDFVRVGIALVEAWRRSRRPGDDTLRRLVDALLSDPDERAAVQRFLAADDVPGLREDDPRYLRGVLAADLNVSHVIDNSDPEEVRYNVFQALQYLADWLCGNGCVALPATLKNARGEPVFVRVMDDLATTERSRWELWAEVQHGRVAPDVFARIVDEEVAFIRAGRATATKRVQVPWEGEAARWYPIAERILRQLVTDPQPPESVSELLLPFTLAPIREAEDPWAAAQALCPGKWRG